MIAKESEFPFAAVVKILQNGYVYTCGSSIISKKYVVTAAHCMFPSVLPVFPSDILIGVGDGDVSSSKVIGVKKILIHPDYNALGSFNDIALLELNETLSFSDSITNIKVDMSVVEEDNEMTAIGWGITSNNSSSPSRTLMKTNLFVNSTKTCSLVRPSFTDKNKDILCLSNGSQGKDTCYGDSGSPVLSQYVNSTLKMNSTTLASTEIYGLMGLTSYGDIIGNNNINLRPKCADPQGLGFYTRVAYYIYFLTNVTKIPLRSLVLDRTLSKEIIKDFNNATKAIEIVDLNIIK
ncbi:hypothetical protein BB561_005222 [Smittium simulii]|uniref:Peptidase S1 domain-containing protein n=1 Tax=Smittium simulii TaxID=133385 RepID=A0A2T9YBG5_9FUNG|nr:hypothetical protein BB561_005222 [Smittium simulii]